MKMWMQLLAVTTLFMSGPAHAAASKESLVIGISAEFENMNPMIASQAATSYMQYLAYRPLVVLSPESKWVPMMIKTFPTIENKLVKKVGSGLEVTIEINDDAFWGDNVPVTCKDVEFAWTVGRNKNVSIPSREGYEMITAIKYTPEKPKRCTFVMSKAKFDYFRYLIDPMPAHVEGPVYEKWKDKPEGYDQNTLYTKDPKNTGLYNGPYVVSEIKLGSHVIFVANKNFKGKQPFFQKVIFKLIPNNGVLAANLQSGNIDMIASAAGLGPDQALAFDRKVKAEKLPYQVLFEDGTIYAHIDLNLDHPALSDIRVRRALAHSFSREEITKSLLEGRAKVALHNITPKDAWYTEKVPVYKYDRKEANRLLDEAGWKMGAKGYREKDGKRLAFTIMAAAGAKINEIIQTYLQSQFKAVGIELFIKNEPARVFFGETTTRRKFDMALYSWVSTPESSPRSTLHSSSIPSAANSWSGQNFPGYNNPEMDKLIDALELELSAKKRAEIAKKIVELYARDVFVLPVYFRQNNIVIPAGMKNFRLIGHQFYETLYIENWSM